MNSEKIIESKTSSPTRRSLSLDGIWQFQYEKESWRDAKVPAPWQSLFPDLVNTSGSATYKRSFTLPEGWGAEEIAIKFGAVSYFCEVLLNGQSIGTHEGAFLPFEFILPSSLLQTQNEIEVRVIAPSANSSEYSEFPFDEIPHGKLSWYGQIGGLWQSVSLEARDPKHIKQVAIIADANGVMAIELAFTDLAKDLSATIEVTDADGNIVAETTLNAQPKVSATLSVPNAKLWSPDQPNLYAVSICLGDETDVIVETIGFRTIETHNGQILLNGEPIYMRGALDQDYYPDTIYTTPSLEFLEDQARKAKHLGLNLLRCHIKIPDPRYFDVADRFGLLVWTEIPNVANFTTRSAARMRETMQGILDRDRNHPSIIAWTIINEDWGTRLVENKEHRVWLKETFDWLKAEDPTRLVVDNSACFPNFHLKTDINDYHYYRSIPERRQEWDDITEQFANGADWTFSGLGDAERTGDEPLIVSEFGVWGLPDPAKLRNKDGSEPHWFEQGSFWGDGVALPHGIENRFDELDMKRTFGSFDKFIEATQWYQYDNLRYEIEAMRLHPSIMGYVITELTDVHWEANGLLDIKRNPRVFHDVFAQINADIVIIPRPTRYAAYSGEDLKITITLATGGLTIPEGAMLSWSGDVSGSASISAVGKTSTVTLDTEWFKMPQVSENRTAIIDFTLEADGKILAKNICEIALYATRKTGKLPTLSTADAELAKYARGLGYQIASAEQADIHLCRALDSADLETIKAGGRCLILADGSVETNNNLRTDMPEGEALHRNMIIDGEKMRPSIDQHLPGITLIERTGTIWRGDWIAGFSWIRRENAFAEIPGGPLFDLSFSNVVPHYLLEGFKPWEFGSNVWSGVVVGWVHKPATIIGQKRVGRGTVVATTLRLTGEAPLADPVATALFDALIKTAKEHPIDSA